MPVYEWTEDYISRRKFRVEADTEEEALMARIQGNADDEWEVDFWSHSLVNDITKVED